MSETTAPSPRRKQVYRVGDRVRIITPEVFVRCGYDMTHESVAREITELDRYDVGAFISKRFGLNGDHALDQVIKEIVHHIHRSRQKDGADRRIFTETKPQIAGIVGTVIAKCITHTGSFCKGCWDEPSHLDIKRRHVILTVSPIGEIWTRYQIEECHVEMVEAAKPLRVGGAS